MAQIGIFQGESLPCSKGVAQNSQFGQRQTADVHPCVDGFDELLHVQMAVARDVNVFSSFLGTAADANQQDECHCQEIFHRLGLFV